MEISVLIIPAAALLCNLRRAGLCRDAVMLEFYGAAGECFIHHFHQHTRDLFRGSLREHSLSLRVGYFVGEAHFRMDTRHDMRRRECSAVSECRERTDRLHGRESDALPECGVRMLDIAGAPEARVDQPAHIAGEIDAGLRPEAVRAEILRETLASETQHHLGGAYVERLT